MNYKRSAFSLSLISLAIALFVGCHAEVPTTAPSQKSNSNTENRVDGDFAKGLLNRAAVIKSSKSITCKKYPNADDVLVDNYNFSKYNPDGTSITWDDVFIKVLTEKGRRDNQSISFYFALPYSTVN